MILKVVQEFNGIVEKKHFAKNDTLVCNDVARANVLIGRGLCVIESFDNPKEQEVPKEGTAVVADAPVEEVAAEAEVEAPKEVKAKGKKKEE